jgi:hypothetical protein
MAEALFGTCGPMASEWVPSDADTKMIVAARG